MIDTILFDLDGTLLPYSQEAFIEVYISKLAKVFERLDMDPKASIEVVWAGTRAMAQNDGSMLNTQRFWQTFSEALEIPPEKLPLVEAACDDFYTNEFDTVKVVMEATSIPKELVEFMKEKGYTLVLATNPLFPQCAVTTRLNWIDLALSDFILATHYANSTYCKPNLGYYNEILSKINKEPAQCIMVGNNPTEDMVAGKLGMELFLVTDYLENESAMDISGFPQGTLAQLASIV
ncbi:MAG: HAD family hydrolase [Oscillospiraceae bacterium]|nr:HAD family hydrolase [Oscillospiraceae bacterium]